MLRKLHNSHQKCIEINQQHRLIAFKHPTMNMQNQNEKKDIFPLASMGALDPGSAHARPSVQPPIDTSGNLSAHVSAA